MEDFQDLVMSVGTHQRDRRRSPLEVAQLLARAVNAGVSRRDCAEALGIGGTQVSTFLKLLDLAPEIQHLADWRGSKHATIPFSSLAELSRLSPRDQIHVAESILRLGLKWKEIVQVVQISNRSEKEIVECIADVVKLRPTVVTRHLFVAAITSEPLSQYLRALSQRSRDDLIERAVTRLTGPGYQTKSRLSSAEFTVLSDHDLTRLVGRSADEIGQHVIDLLEAMRSQP